MSAAASEVQRISYFREHPDCATLFLVVYDYYRQFQSLPSMDVILMDLGSKNQALPQPWPTFFLPAVKDMLTKWYAETHWDDVLVKGVINDAIKEDALLQVRSAVGDNDDFSVVSESISQAQTRLSSDVFSALGTETAWSDPATALWQGKREALGCDFIDRVLDGGLAQQDCMLFVAPTGGGKTTLGLQVSSQFVRRSQNVVYLSTEQQQQGDLSLRQFVLGTGRPRSEFRDGWDSVPQETKDLIHRLAPQWINHFHFVDCRRSNRPINSIDDLFVPIDALIDQGKQIDMVILDWWGRLRARLITNAQGSDFQARMGTQDWLGDFIDGIKHRNSRLMVLHQMSGEAAGKSTKAKPSTHNAQEDKNLNNLFEFGFGTSPLNSDNQCRINCDKARSTAKGDGWIQLDPQNCRFFTVDIASMGDDTPDLLPGVGVQVGNVSSDVADDYRSLERGAEDA